MSLPPVTRDMLDEELTELVARVIAGEDELQISIYSGKEVVKNGKDYFGCCESDNGCDVFFCWLLCVNGRCLGNGRAVRGRMASEL